MAYTSEIEKLEARYRENPKGRNFAPLADAYRKAGLIDNAIELCQAGLELHPDYVSGHIVHGRCLVDKKDDVGAEAVFRKVLDLDPENILALKVLAEIAERNNQFDHAMEWLNRLLLADPMNGEAAEGLSRVRSKANAQPAVPPAARAEPVATLVVDPHPEPQLKVEHEQVDLQVDHQASSQAALGLESMEGPFDLRAPEAPTASTERPDFELERTSESSPDASVTAPTEAVQFEGLDFNAVTADPSLAESLQIEEPPEIEPDTSVHIDGLARTQYEGSGLFKVDESQDPVPFEERPTSPVADLPLIMPEDVQPAAAGSPARSSHVPVPVESRTVAPPPPVTPGPPALGLTDDDDGAADTTALSQVEPVLTETMAELYLRQGHREDAVRVYQALAAQRPHDARLRGKVEELSAPPRSRSSGGGQSAGAFLKGILSARPGAPAPALPEPQAARAPAPPPPAPAPPVDEMQTPPLSAAPASDNQPGEPAPGSPTRPASDAISLDSVFGEESGRASAPASSDSEADSVTAPPSGGGFSFDDFFGSAAAPAGGDKPAASNARPSRPSGRTRVPEKEEDLDQFQAWLKSLKA